MTKTITKTDNGTKAATAVADTNETAPVTTSPVTAVTYHHLFQAREHLPHLKQMSFPPKTAVKVWRILKQLDNDFLPLMEQYQRLIRECGTAVPDRPGEYKFDDVALAKINEAMEPLLKEPLTAEIKERLTLDDLEQAEAAITPALLDAIWFILDEETSA